jgi:hypothetical protein
MSPSLTMTLWINVLVSELALPDIEHWLKLDIDRPRYTRSCKISDLDLLDYMTKTSFSRVSSVLTPTINLTSAEWRTKPHSLHTVSSAVKDLCLMTVSISLPYRNAYLKRLLVIVDALLLGFDDGQDILTLSLGGPDGWTESSSAVVASRLVEAGKVVTISAGNDVSFQYYIPK